MRTTRLRVFVTLALVALPLVLLTAGCAEAKGLPSNGVTAQSPLPNTTTITTSAAGTMECSKSELMAVAESQIPRAEGISIATIRVTHCRNGYTRIVLEPAPQGSTDDLPVFLHKVDGRWSIIYAGTGLDCSYEQGIDPEMLKACRALGLP